MSSDKRVLILEATADLISEHGLHCCPMSLVAKHAKVGAGTIYRYFATKEDLIRELYFCVCKSLADYCYEGYTQEEPVKDRLELILRRFYNYLIASPRDAQLLDQLWATPAIEASAHSYAIDEIHRIPTQLLAEAKEKGIIKPLQNEILLAFTFGTLFSIVQRQTQTPNRFLEPVNLDDLLNACWDAIKI